MRILVVAPHPDDEILGVGGTMAKHIANGDDVFVCIMTKGCAPIFDENQVQGVKKEAMAAHKYLGVRDTIFLDIPAAMMEQVPRYEVNGNLSDLVQKLLPDVVYIPHFGDMQKDHQIVSDACMVSLRPKFEHKVKKVLAYETLSETEWNIPHVANVFMPNVYNDVSEFFDQKIAAMKLFKSQLSAFPNPRSIEAIEALAKLRGSTVNVLAAEAFVLIREIN